MSGGQRKRVTFADLVTARLPSTAPQQTPDPQTVEPVVAPPAVLPPPTVPEQPTAPDNLAAAHPSADIHLAPSLNPSAEPLAEADITRQSPDDRQPLRDWQPSYGSQPVDARRTLQPAGGGQTDSQTEDDSQSAPDSQSLGDRQPLREVKGYLRLANTIVDSLLPTLDVYEQAVFIQLYRLAHGFGNFTCKVSLPALQARTGVKPTSLKQAIARLQARGVVEKISADIGFGREQGITYWVSSDGRQTYGDWQSQGGRQPSGDDNKRKEHLKESKLKGELTPEQIKACPDCGGVGMWYPEGPGRGVARCYHPSLKAKS
ncbi:MAG TPA: hypothetical protein VF586_14935 [Pyrinomonadaceae bacterium]|jgi:hypothetical protein